MDLQTRKLNAIEYLLSIESENAISNIESIILQNRISDNQLFTPFTKEELIERAKQSEADIQSNKLISSEDLRLQIERW